MPDIFIAAAPGDSERAQQLATALRARGFSLNGAARNAKAVIAVRGADADESVAAAAEAAAARNALINVRFGGSDAAGTEDLSNWPGGESDAAFERVVQAAARLRGRPAIAATTRTRDARLLRRVMIGGGLAALALLAGFIITQSLNRVPPLPPLPGAEQTSSISPQSEDEDFAASEFTDSPGPAESYGLTQEEMNAADPRGLIQLALERTAIESIEAGAAQGDTLGQTLLCLARTYGEGLPEDRGEARRNCERASASNSALGAYMLSTFLREGEPGYAPNPGVVAQADALLRRAALAGDPRAQTDLARAAIEAERNDEARRFADAARSQGYAPAMT
ncbi:MAG: tetratricopeptide repeat protein, partial [Hyphomonadaceae bacterium]